MRISLCVVLIFSFFLLFYLGAAAQEASSQNFVFVMTNRAYGNSVGIFQRSADGSLSFLKEVPTQGLGTGFTLDPLQSQGSLSLSNDGKLLFAVNPASGDITSFTVSSAGITFASKAPSGGALPVSLTAFNGLVYVLNQLGTANIAGFTADSSGIYNRCPGRSPRLPTKRWHSPPKSASLPTESSCW